MVCPYCETRNVPGAATCSHCGAILRGSLAAKTKQHTAARSRSAAGLIVVVITLGIVGAAIGGAIAHIAAPGLFLITLLAGGLVGIVIGAVVGGGRTLYLSNLYRARHVALQKRVNASLTTAEAHYAAELKKPAPDPQIRLNLAAWHLLKEETEKAMQVLQAAQKLGAAGLEFDNNAGVALAMRGSLPQAIGLFQRAVTHSDAPAHPFANLAHLHVETLEDPQAGEHALTAIRDALIRDPKNSRYYSLLGMVFVREDRLDEAEKQFEQAVSLASAAHRRPAEAQINLGVLRYLQGNTREAAQLFAAALGADIGNARALSNAGLAQFIEGERDNGLQKLRNAVYLDPRCAGAQASLGYGLCRRRVINEGIRACREALALNPHLFEPHANLGKVYADAGLPDLAEHYLKRAQALQPRSWEVMLTNGVVKIALNQMQEAMQCFESALHLKPQHPPILIGLAAACAFVGKDADAARRMEIAQRLDPENPKIHGHRAWLFLRVDSASAALAELEIALQKLPQNAILHNNHGLAQVELGAYEVALDSLQQAQKLDSELTQVHYHLGCVYALLKQPDPAIKAWETAAKYEPGNADCFANLGAALYRKGDYDAAMTHFRHVLQLRQDRPEDYSNLGLAYAKQGVALKKKADSVSKATQLIVRDTVDERAKQSVEKQRQAIEMFDRALAMTPGNVILHSNRGLACYFANRPEDAMAEWAAVTRIDPIYASRRGTKQQSEFDDSQVDFIPLDVPKRAIMLPLATADCLHRFVWGYDVAGWELILSDPALVPLEEQIQELQGLERVQRALRL